MSVVATLLFGSLARSDQCEGSDTDLLMISLGKERRHVSIGHLSLFLCPWSQLAQDAQDGDLFVCHLVREAKALIDPDDYLPRLRRAFQFRSTYEAETRRAAELGWYLVRFGKELNASLLARRSLWCIRTILIARSAEQRDPIFAPQRLAERTHSEPARELLNERRQQRDEAVLRASLRQFLVDETPADPVLELCDRSAFVKKFVASSNKVALQTLLQGEKSQMGYI
jgi:predicted nucleotidyltransferase/nucleotide-binding universal stress UspA family protein